MKSGYTGFGNQLNKLMKVLNVLISKVWNYLKILG